MKQDICSIPISEIFEPKQGCPFCKMRDMLEDRMATYITGAAMMEPDVRVETNRLGFCKTHFDHILQRGSRLSVALILETLLAETEKDLMSVGTPIKKAIVAGDNRENSCFTCENIEKNMLHLCSTVLSLWQSEEEFRELYANQTHICVPHYHMITKYAQKKMNKKNLVPFMTVTSNLSRKYMQEVTGDVSHFCRMFDYRNAGGDWGNSKDSIERAIEYLTGRPIDTSTQTEGKNR
ncbi:MAG: DUF6062 family protein [Clostridia bacterium]